MRPSRRRFLQFAGAAAAAAVVPRISVADPLFDLLDTYDDGMSEIPDGLAGDPARVIVIGAGFAGLAVASALRAAGVECVVLEGRGRIGGRALTIDVGGAPVDLGCSWIHDPALNPLSRFAARAGVLQSNATIELDYPISRVHDQRTGSVPPHQSALAVARMLRFEESDSASIARRLGEAASMKDGILAYLDEQEVQGDPRRWAEYFLRLITELPDATDWDLDSLWWWANYESPYPGFGEGSFPKGGYGRLVSALAGESDVRLGYRVTHVAAADEGVMVRAMAASGSEAVFEGSHVVVTVPLGVLREGAIGFDPPLPARKARAIDALGFGTFEKCVLRFAEPWWVGEHAHVFFLSDPELMRFPLILDYFHLTQEPILVAFNAGSNGAALNQVGDDEVQARMLEVLRTVRGRPVPDPVARAVTRWHSAPFTRGAYSFIAVGAGPEDQKALAAPHAGRILFAGEATSTERYGYADGALTTGIREAKRLLRAPSVVLRPS